MGLLRVLQPDLRTLSFEARKKNPNIKDAAENAVRRLRALEEQFPEAAEDSQPSAAYIIAVAASDDVLSPFIQACETKNLKLVAVAVSSLQKLISRAAISMDGVTNVLNVLEPHILCDDESVELKILQAMNSLMTSPLPLYGSSMARALRVCFLLHNHKNPVVRNTAAATLRQVSVMLLEKAANVLDVSSQERAAAAAAAAAAATSSTTTTSTKPAPEPAEDSSTSSSSSSSTAANDESGAASTSSSSDTPTTAQADDAKADATPALAAGESGKRCVADAMALIEDLCLITGGDTPQWLPRDIQVAPSFGFDLIESLLTNNSALFHHSTEFGLLLKDKVCPLVIKSFKSGSSFGLVIRLLRMIVTIVTYYQDSLTAECEVFLSRLVRMLRVENPPWLYGAVLEVFLTFFQRPSLLYTIFQSYDAVPNRDMSGFMFQSITQAQAAFVQKALEMESIELANAHQPRVLDMLAAAQPPVVPIWYLAQTSRATLTRLVSSLRELALETPRGATQQEAANADAPATFKSTSATVLRDEQMVAGMVTSAWPSLMSALSSLLSKRTSSTFMKSLLDTYIVFIETSCILSLETPRDAFLTSLCNTTLPLWYTIEQSPEALRANASTQQLLTDKNVLAVQALLCVGRTLGQVLEGGWFLVLECCEKLDHVMRIRGSQGAGSANAPSVSSVTSEQIAMLCSGLDAIFRESNNLSDAAFYHLVVGLSRLSAVHLQSPHSLAAQAPTRKSFALTRLIEISSSNIARLEVVWDALLEHLRVVCNHSNPSIRSFGVDAATQLITEAFAYHSHASAAATASDQEPPSPSAASSSEHSQRAPSKASLAQPSEQSIYLQTRLLEALEELSRSQHSETRHRTLESLHNILQSSGQGFLQGWPLVLSILMTVAVNNDSPHISEAFKSVQLICSDFIFNLPSDCLALFITTTGCYGMQSSDINISLTAIGLLWPIADFLVRHGSAIVAADQSHGIGSKSLSSATASTDKDDAAVSAATADKEQPADAVTHLPHASPTVGRLWISVFTEMKQLCLDRRFEVRNCALLTMFKTLQMHGTVFQPETWEHCIWQILVPILAEVKSAAAAAANDELNVEIGKSGGKSVKLLVHHSRNNAQKQWNETCVFAFNGTVRLIKNLHHSVLHKLESFDSFWRRILEFAVQFASASSSEVSVNAIVTTQELAATVARTDMPEQLAARKVLIEQEVASAAERESMDAGVPVVLVGPGVFVSVSQWKELWGVFESISNAISENQPAIESLANVLLQVHPVARPFLDVDDTFLLLRIFARLSTMSIGSKDNELSKVQKSVLNFFAGVPPIDSEDILMALLNQLLTLVALAVGHPFGASANSPPNDTTPAAAAATSSTSSSGSSGASEEASEERGNALLSTPRASPKFFRLAEEALRTLCTIYVSESSPRIQAKLFETLTSVLGAAIMSKYSYFTTTLWRSAVTALITVIRVGLPSLETSGTYDASNKQSHEALLAVWTQLADIYEDFLLHDRAQLPSKLSPQDLKLEAEIDQALVESLGNDVLSYSKNCAMLQPRFIDILCNGTRTFISQSRELFGQACYQVLFLLCSRASVADSEYSCNERVAALALPVVVACSKTVLHKFVDDDRKAGRMPLPRSRLAEILFVLQQLQALELPSTLELVGVSEDSPLFQNKSKKRHLLYLFPLLCDCITTREEGFKDRLRDIFHMVAKEMKLE